MRKKKVHHEEHPDETWLIPYADMLTLLLALFIVMFAMSKVDSEKFKAASEQFNVIFSGGQGVLSQQAAVSSGQDSPSSAQSNTVIEQDKMTEIKHNLETQIESKGYTDKVSVELNNDGLEIAIQDAALFNSGDANVLNEVTPLLVEIAGMIKGLDNNIRIVGHTDNVPISNSKFRSNWDLSAIRAINVMNFLVERGGVSQSRLSIQAYGEQQPKYSNDTEDGRSKNRRVEIFIIRKYPVATN